MQTNLRRSIRYYHASATLCYIHGSPHVQGHNFWWNPNLQAIIAPQPGPKVYLSTHFPPASLILLCIEYPLRKELVHKFYIARFSTCRKFGVKWSPYMPIIAYVGRNAACSDHYASTQVRNGTCTVCNGNPHLTPQRLSQGSLSHVWWLHHTYIHKYSTSHPFFPSVPPSFLLKWIGNNSWLRVLLGNARRVIYIPTREHNHGVVGYAGKRFWEEGFWVFMVDAGHLASIEVLLLSGPPRWDCWVWCLKNGYGECSFHARRMGKKVW